jgi:ferredoxin
MRFQILKVINPKCKGLEDCGDCVAMCEYASDAYGIISLWAGNWIYGVAVLDTEDNTLDLGDEIIHLNRGECKWT